MSMLEQWGMVLANSKPPTISGDVRPGDFWSDAALTKHELVAMTAVDWVGFYVVTGNKGGAANYGFASLFVGEAGNEFRIANIRLAMQFNIGGWNLNYVQVPVAAGSRISIGFGGTSGMIGDFQIQGVPADADLTGTPPFSRIDIGPIEVTSGSGSEYGRGILVDPGGVANTMSAWKEMSVANLFSGAVGNNLNNILQGDGVVGIAEQYQYLGFTLDTNGELSYNNEDYVLDVAYGPSGSEIMLLENLHMYVHNYEIPTLLGGIVWVPWNRPPGDRIAVRVQSGEIDPADRLVRVYMLGVL